MDEVLARLFLVDLNSQCEVQVISVSCSDAQCHLTTRETLGADVVAIEYRGVASPSLVVISTLEGDRCSELGVLNLHSGSTRLLLHVAASARLVFKFRPLARARASSSKNNFSQQQLLELLLGLFEFEAAEREHLAVLFSSCAVARSGMLPMVPRAGFAELLRSLGMPAENAERASSSLMDSVTHLALDEANFTIGLLLMDPANTDLTLRCSSQRGRRLQDEALRKWRSWRLRLVFRMFDASRSGSLDRTDLKSMLHAALSGTGMPCSCLTDGDLERMHPSTRSFDLQAFENLLAGDMEIHGVKLAALIFNVCTLPKSAAYPKWVHEAKVGQVLLRNCQPCKVLQIVGRPPEFLIEDSGGSTRTCPWYRLQPESSVDAKQPSAASQCAMRHPRMTPNPEETESAQEPPRNATSGMHAPAVQGPNVSPQASSLPAHWSTPVQKFPSQGWALVDITHDNATFRMLERCLTATEDSTWLGCGRDVTERGMYNGLALSAAWRIEHPSLWRKYTAACEEVAVDMRRLGSRVSAVQLRTEWSSATAGLPLARDRATNERLLVHGTSSKLVFPILAGGFNERLSNNGMFGHGNYLADDPGKADQYTDEDVHFADEGFRLHELHKRLYRRGRAHPGHVRYMFLCRVVLGHVVRTKDGETSLDHEGDLSLYDSDMSRELAEIPGVSPPIRFHALVAERGDFLKRYREIVQYHSDRIFPEYLLAYQRVYPTFEIGQRVMLSGLKKTPELNGACGRVQANLGERLRVALDDSADRAATHVRVRPVHLMTVMQSRLPCGY